LSIYGLFDIFFYIICIQKKGYMTEGFYIFLISSSFAFLTFIGRMCYKSKCSEIKCFGIRVIRDVEQETTDRSSSLQEEREERYV
jgi:hypothetical protein